MEINKLPLDMTWKAKFKRLWHEKNIYLKIVLAQECKHPTPSIDKRSYKSEFDVSKINVCVLRGGGRGECEKGGPSDNNYRPNSFSYLFDCKQGGEIYKYIF